MSYHSVGKEVWDNLPSMFYNNELANQLECDQSWWVYTYSFPSISQPGHQFGFDCMIKFTKHDNSFKKILKPI